MDVFIVSDSWSEPARQLALRVRDVLIASGLSVGLHSDHRSFLQRLRRAWGAKCQLSLQTTDGLPIEEFDFAISTVRLFQEHKETGRRLSPNSVVDSPSFTVALIKDIRAAQYRHHRRSIRGLIEAFRTVAGGLGVIPLALMGIGGFTFIDLLEKAVLRRDLSLITPFEIVLNGYQRIVAIVGATLEPLVEPLIRWLNEQFNWHISLQEHWRSLVVLAFVYVFAVARAFWRHESRYGAALMAILFGYCGIVAALAVGIVPFAGPINLDESAQYILPTAASATMILVALRLIESVEGLQNEFARTWVVYSAMLVCCSFIGAAAGAGAEFVVVAQGVMIAGMAIRYLLVGLVEDLDTESRAGITILGGYLTAALILFSDWLVKMTIASNNA